MRRTIKRIIINNNTVDKLIISVDHVMLSAYRKVKKQMMKSFLWKFDVC